MLDTFAVIVLCLCLSVVIGMWLETLRKRGKLDWIWLR